MTRFSRLVLVCSDLSRSLAFYRAAGLEMVAQTGTVGFDYCEANGRQLWLGPAGGLRLLVTTGAYIEIVTRNHDNVVANLVAVGAKQLGSDIFLDPDQNIVEIKLEA